MKVRDEAVVKEGDSILCVNVGVGMFDRDHTKVLFRLSGVIPPDLCKARVHDAHVRFYSREVWVFFEGFAKLGEAILIRLNHCTLSVPIVYLLELLLLLVLIEILRLWLGLSIMALLLL